MKILFFDREFGFWGFKHFPDEVNAGTWLKPGARGCKTKERSYKCAEVFALPLISYQRQQPLDAACYLLLTEWLTFPLAHRFANNPFTKSWNG